MSESTRASTLTGARAFAYALAAPYNADHGLPQDVLEAPAASPKLVAMLPNLREMLARDWGVEDRDDLVQRMDRLADHGHRHRIGEELRRYAVLWRPQVASLREQMRDAIREGDEDAPDDLWRLDAVQEDREGLRGSPLLAFDAARGVMLARTGAMLGWLSEGEAFGYMEDAARDARRGYESWKAYGEDFKRGRLAWAARDDGDRFDGVVAKLLRRDDSPWRRVPWDTPGLDIPRPVRRLVPGAPLWSLERN